MNSSLFNSINAIRQSAECDSHLGQFLLAHEFVGGEDDGGFLLFLDLLGDAFGAVAVQGGVGATQEGEVRFVYQIKQPVARFVEEIRLCLLSYESCPVLDLLRCTRGGGPGFRSPVDSLR